MTWVSSERTLPNHAALEWWIAVAWRVAIAIAFPILWAINSVYRIRPWDAGYNPHLVFTWRGIFSLSLVIALSATKWGVPDEFHRRRLWIDVLGWIAGFVWILLALARSAAICSLTFLMIRGMQLQPPIRFEGAYLFVDDPTIVGRHLTRLALTSLLCLAVVWTAAELLVSRAWHGTRRARRLSMGCIVICLLAGTAYVTYERLLILPAISPELAEAFVFPPVPNLLADGALVALFSATAAYRLHSCSGDGNTLSWRCRHTYWNESRVVAALVFLPFAYTSCVFYRAVFSEALAAPQLYGDLAVLWLTGTGLIRRRRQDHAKAMQTAHCIRLNQLFATFFVVAALIMLAAESVMWCSFTYWTFPW